MVLGVGVPAVRFLLGLRGHGTKERHLLDLLAAPAILLARLGHGGCLRLGRRCEPATLSGSSDQQQLHLVALERLDPALVGEFVDGVDRILERPVPRLVYFSRTLPLLFTQKSDDVLLPPAYVSLPRVAFYLGVTCYFFGHYNLRPVNSAFRHEYPAVALPAEPA